MTDEEEQRPGKFFQVHEKSKNIIKLFQKKFLCIDQNQSYLFGDYDSETARTIRVQLLKCKGEVYCKTEEEIISYIHDKYLLLLNN